MTPPRIAWITRSVAIALLVTLAAPVRAQDAPPLDALASVATPDLATRLWLNPAGAGVRYPSELSLTWGRVEPERDLWAASWAVRGLGLAAARVQGLEQRYHASLAAGDVERLRIGWAGTLRLDEPGGDRVTDHALGLLARPVPWLSLGATAGHLGQPHFAGSQLVRDYTVGLGLRPLALSRPRAHTLGTTLTLTADVGIAEDERREEARARFGVELEPLPGIALRAQGERGGFRVGLALLGPRSGYHGSTSWREREGSDPARLAQAHTLSLHRAEDASALAGRRDRRVAVVRVGGALVDEPAGGFSLLGEGGGTAVRPIHDQLERAERDPLTRGVLLELRGTAGLAHAEELLPRLDRLRAAGKPVVGFLEFGGRRADLLLAAACDESFATPRASFGELGLRTERRSYRSLLERFGITVERTSVGRYKSAYRPFSVDSTTDADEESIVSLLDERQRVYVEKLAAEADVPAERFAHILDGRPWTSADLAVAGLLDSVGYREQALARVGALARLGSRPRTERLDRIPLARREWNVPTRLAVVYASGGIETGRSGSDLLSGATLGHETLIGQLERAFSRRDVAAVVLRVESPGGSALASDLIHHATRRLRSEKNKPLLASMGGVAASGGYYIAMGADQVWANPSTVTGSIGVVSIKPSLEQLWAKQGVRQEAWQRGDHMAGWSLHRDWTAHDQAVADSATIRYYRAFVSQAAADRGVPGGELEPHAQGRVWLGTQALERRLVDRLGGLEDAIGEARRLAGIPADEKIRVLELRRPQGSLLQRVIGNWVRAGLEPTLRLPRPGEARFEAELPDAP